MGCCLHPLVRRIGREYSRRAPWCRHAAHPDLYDHREHAARVCRRAGAVAVDGRAVSAGRADRWCRSGAFAMNDSFLLLAGVTKRYGAGAAVDDLSLTVATGDSVVILGPSGCG